MATISSTVQKTTIAATDLPSPEILDNLTYVIGEIKLALLYQMIGDSFTQRVAINIHADGVHAALVREDATFPQVVFPVGQSHDQRISMLESLTQTSRNNPFGGSEYDNTPTDEITRLVSRHWPLVPDVHPVLLSSRVARYIALRKLNHKITFSQRQGVAVNRPQAVGSLQQGSAASQAQSPLITTNPANSIAVASSAMNTLSGPLGQVWGTSNQAVSKRYEFSPGRELDLTSKQLSILHAIGPLIGMNELL